MGLIRSIRTEQRIDYSFTVSEWDWHLESVGFCGEENWRTRRKTLGAGVN